MKKIRLVVYILLLTAMLASCSSEPEKDEGDVVLTDAQLKGFDNKILSTLANDGFVFNVKKQSEKLTELPVTIELYKKGKLAGPLLEADIIGSEGEKKTKFMIAKQLFDDDKDVKQKWIIASFSHEIESSFEGLEDKITGPSPFSMASTYAKLPLKLNKGEKKTIAAFVSTNFNGIAESDLEAVLKNPKATSKYERVYLIRIEAK
ncbi:hypothetical protein QR721_12920 [Aciduricibacillus chroicocephali]|uniref:Lipoprotein n=1 Tax=Aciduricibacillus chroicocephali TaxID=3054939 RepID=A0ABY9KW52_9BACI|nr:hypothetical protein QR721_12920 [Bacillaceae bacterium 44XB]